MKDTTVYIIVMIEEYKDALNIEPVAVYSSLEKALDWVDELEDKVLMKNDNAIFDVLEYELDAKPLLLEFMEKMKEKKDKTTEDMVTKVLKSMMDEGLVEQLIGEDGRFYYELTKDGKLMAEDIPQIIRHKFKKK
jgi:hypothetical protein